jgi:hypothetical protein
MKNDWAKRERYQCAMKKISIAMFSVGMMVWANVKSNANVGVLLIRCALLKKKRENQELGYSVSGRSWF